MSHFLVQYGLGAWLGQFRAEAELRLNRGTRAVIRTLRGVELGTLLDAVEERHAHLLNDHPGEILRAATDADEVEFQSRREQLNQILDAAQRRAEALGLPLLFLDGEVLLDGSRAILQAIHHAECEATSLFEELSERFRLPVMLHDLTTTPKPEPAGGCGKPGCGSEGGGGCSSCGTEGGGCSTGSCSKGKVKSPEELTSYFGQLRQQMEASRERIPLS
jgi:hypothetical protein